MLYALNDPLASFVFIYCIIVWKCMIKCVLRIRIKIYIYTCISIKQMFEAINRTRSGTSDKFGKRITESDDTPP